MTRICLAVKRPCPICQRMYIPDYGTQLGCCGTCTEEAIKRRQQAQAKEVANVR